MTRPNRRDHDVLENDMMVDFMEAVAAAERKARETRDADERAILMARAEALRVAAKALEDRESDDPGLATIRRKLDEIEIQAADDIGFHTKDKHPRMDVIKGNPASRFSYIARKAGPSECDPGRSCGGGSTGPRRMAVRETGQAGIRCNG